MNNSTLGHLRFTIPWATRLPKLLAVGLLVLGVQSASQAAMLTVNLAGFDVRFKGNDSIIVDDTADAYDPNGDPADANPLDAATLTNNSTMMVIGDWMRPADQIYGDLLIEDGLANLAPNTLTNVPLGAGTNEFLWFVDDGTELRLRFDTLNVQRTVLGGNLSEIFIMTGSATVLAQNLPGGMAYENNVGFAYIASDSMFIGDDNGLALTGVVTITGEMRVIPEPAALALACAGGLAMVAFPRRRRRAKA